MKFLIPFLFFQNFSQPPIWSNDCVPREIMEKQLSNNLSSLSSLDATSPESLSGTLKRTDSIGKSCDDAQTPASFDAFTPESDCSSRPPLWPNNSAQARRQSLSLQSSEEKDESASSPPTSKPHSKLFVLRSDSMSDNEMSDRTPPPRDRARYTQKYLIF